MKPNLKWILCFFLSFQIYSYHTAGEGIDPILILPSSNLAKMFQFLTPAELAQCSSLSRNWNSKMNNYKDEDQKRKNAYTLLTSQARRYIKKLGRPIYTYNYVALKYIKEGRLSHLDQLNNPILDVRDEDVQNYLKRKIRSYWSLGPAVSNRTDTDGFYTAGDPFQSRHFGGSDDNWALFRVELPKGLTFLDITTWDQEGASINPEDTPDIVAAFEVLECKIGRESFRYLFVKGPNYWKKKIKCRAIAFSILKELGVEALFYPWGTGTQFYHTTNSNPHATILLNENLISENSTVAFTRTLPNGDDRLLEERIILESLAKDIDVQKHPKETSPRDNQPFWPSLSEITYPNIGKWEQEHLYGCGTPID